MAHSVFRGDTVGAAIRAEADDGCGGFDLSRYSEPKNRSRALWKI
jgi:hypothetical protein